MLGLILSFNSERDACERRLQEAEQWLKRSEAEREALGMVVVDEEKFKKLPVSIASARAIAALVAAIRLAPSGMQGRRLITCLKMITLAARSPNQY